MHSIIVVPMDSTCPADQIHLAPSESLPFGRAARSYGPHLTIPHEGVSRAAGEITAAGAYWTLSNLSGGQTYVVENPEGAGEHVKIAPGRLDAPIPFEFSRVVLPAGNELLSFDVWAPRHDYLDCAGTGDGAPTASAFPSTAASGTSRSWSPCAPHACAANHTLPWPPPTSSSTCCVPVGRPRPAPRCSGTSTISRSNCV